jgi:hypothetical protein
MMMAMRRSLGSFLQTNRLQQRHGKQLVHQPPSKIVRPSCLLFHDSVSNNDDTALVQVKIEGEPGVATLTLNRPPANSLNLDL